MVKTRISHIVKEHNYLFNYHPFLLNPFFPEINLDVIEKFTKMLGKRNLNHLYVDKLIDIEEKYSGHRLINFIDNRFTGIYGH